MPIRAYCVRLAGQPAPARGLTGVDEAPVRLIEEPRLGLWVSEGRQAEPTVDRVRMHDRVVREALRSATPAPMRFGTLFADEDAARAALRNEQARYLVALTRVAGSVEMGIRLVWSEAPAEPTGVVEPSAAATGREYLEQRRSESERSARLRQRADAALESTLDCFVALDLAAVTKLLPEPGVAATVAHLVPRDALGSYRDCVARARAAVPDAALVVSGPWAPYSFV